MKAMKLLWFVIGLTMASTFQTANKEQASFSELAKLLQQPPDDLATFQMHCSYLSNNLRIGTLEAIKDKTDPDGLPNIYQSIVKLWVKDLAKLKDEVSGDLAKTVNALLFETVKEFIHYIGGADEILTVIPEKYSKIDVEKLGWNSKAMRYLLSNYRRFSWIVQRRETDLVGHTLKGVLKPVVDVFNSSIEKIISNIQNDPKKNVKENADNAIKALKKIKSLIEDDVKAIDSDLIEDWALFEPSVDAFHEQSKSFFKGITNWLVSKLSSLTKNEKPIQKQVMDLYTGIYLTVIMPEIIEELKPTATELKKTMLDLILATWDSVINSNQQTKILNHDLFESFFVTVSEMGPSSEEIGRVIERVYSKLDPIAKLVTPKSEKFKGVDFFTKLVSKLELLNKPEKRSDELKNSKVTILLSICMAISDIPLPQFKTMLTSIQPQIPLILYETSSYINQEKTKGIVTLVAFLKQSKLMSSEAELVTNGNDKQAVNSGITLPMVYAYASAEYLSADSKVIGDSVSLIGFFKYTTEENWTKQPQIVQSFLGPMKIVSMVEIPNTTECLDLKRFSPIEIRGAQNFLAQNEFKNIKNCLQVTGVDPKAPIPSPVQTQSSPFDPKNPSKLDIGMKLEEEPPIGTVVNVEIKFMGNKTYEVKAHMVGVSDGSATGLIGRLSSAEKICRTSEMNLDKCLLSINKMALI
jgi:hypothetical protein